MWPLESGVTLAQDCLLVPSGDCDDPSTTLRTSEVGPCPQVETREWIRTHLKQNPSVYKPAWRGPIQEDPVHRGGLSREAISKGNSVQGGPTGNTGVFFASTQLGMCLSSKLERPPYSEIGLLYPTKKLPVEGCAAMVSLTHQNIAGDTKYEFTQCLVIPF